MAAKANVGSRVRDILHVEARLASPSIVNTADVQAHVKSIIEYRAKQLYEGKIECETDAKDWQAYSVSAPIVGLVDRIRVCESTGGQRVVALLDEPVIIVHIYHAASQDDIEELTADDAAPDGDAERGQDDTLAATVLELPNECLEGGWDNLVYEEDIKGRLLRYIQTTLLLSDAKVDANVISWNRLLLLHGPPGTGKTSLCRALSQKLSIRLAERYTYGKLVEINSHSLFSKWFSESGKLVQRMFTMIYEMVSDPDAFIVVLIDEVESLTAARTTAAGGGAEPGDAVRVVNALLTQLDKLKRCPNVLIVTTSNLSESIDSAFIDRADIKQYIGLPSPEAVYTILLSCLQELMRTGLVEGTPVQPWSLAVADHAKHSLTFSAGLMQLAVKAQGLSGRTLRRLPVLAYARRMDLQGGSSMRAEDWLHAMHDAADEARVERDGSDVGSRRVAAAMPS